MTTLPVATGNFLGLIELDHAGTVLYSHLDGDASRGASDEGIRGSNYYTEVAPFANVADFRERLSRFAAGGNSAECFVFDCRCHDGRIVPVRVLLARMRRRAGDGSESLLVHLKKV